MKNFPLLIAILLLPISILSQESATYKNNQQFDNYITRAGDTITVGDRIVIGLPRTDVFTFITQGNQPTGAFLSGDTPIIQKIISKGTSKRGYKIYATFKGYGFIPVYVDIESALRSGEIEVY